MIITVFGSSLLEGEGAGHTVIRRGCGIHSHPAPSSGGGTITEYVTDWKAIGRGFLWSLMDRRTVVGTTGLVGNVREKKYMLSGKFLPSDVSRLARQWNIRQLTAWHRSSRNAVASLVLSCREVTLQIIKFIFSYRSKELSFYISNSVYFSSANASLS